VQYTTPEGLMIVDVGVHEGVEWQHGIIEFWMVRPVAGTMVADDHTSSDYYVTQKNR
jgi:hypothetical protein